MAKPRDKRRRLLRWSSLALYLFAGGCGDSRPPGPWKGVDLWQSAPVDSDLEPRDARRLSGEVRTLEGRSLRALRLPAGAWAAWEVDLGQAPIFSFRPIPEDEPCVFVVAVRDEDGKRHRVLRKQFQPPGYNVSRDVDVDLRDFAGTSVRLVLSGQGKSCRTARWGSPMIFEHEAASDGDGPPGTGKTNIVFIGIDTLRADALGAYGRKPSVSPAIDRLASQSDVWDNAFTTINNTNPSFISLMTGMYPKNHGVYDLKTSVATTATTLAEHLHGAGYHTLAVVAARHLRVSSGLRQGFDEYLKARSMLFAETVVNQAMLWLEDPQEPFFLWLHLFDPHVPHNPPVPYNLGYFNARPTGLLPADSWTGYRDPGPLEFRPGIRMKGNVGLYPGEVAYVDRQIDRLLAFMKSRGLLETTTIVLVADHGETLGERGRYFDHSHLHENTTHVPLMIRRPGTHEGRRFSGLVQHFDVFPTLLRLAGIRAPETDARDLYENERGRRAVFAENANGGGWMIRTARYRLLVVAKPPDQGRYLYDLASDPEELHNLAGTGLPVEEEMLETLERWKQDTRPLETPEPQQLSEEEVRELEALGYVQ